MFQALLVDGVAPTYPQKLQKRQRGSCDSDSDDQVVMEMSWVFPFVGNDGRQKPPRDAFWLGASGLTTRTKIAYGSFNSEVVDTPSQEPFIIVILPHFRW